MKEKKKTPPSRLRYEQAHPTVSCRVSREMYDQLEMMRKNEGKSFADILKIGLGRLKVKAERDRKVRDTALTEGYEQGYSEAENVFKVTYPCNVCGEMLEVKSEKEKAAIAEYMQEHGWGHQSCHEGR